MLSQSNTNYTYIHGIYYIYFCCLGPCLAVLSVYFLCSTPGGHRKSYGVPRIKSGFTSSEPGKPSVYSIIYGLPETHYFKSRDREKLPHYNEAKQ